MGCERRSDSDILLAKAQRRQGRKGCHFDRREKSLIDPSRSLGMTGIGPSTSRLGAFARDNPTHGKFIARQHPIAVHSGSRVARFPARAATFQTLHGAVETPIFMPVGTQATVKAQTVESLQATGARLLLANTYHLLLRPGAEVFKKFGGIHRFMNWDRPGADGLRRLPDFLAASFASHE